MERRNVAIIIGVERPSPDLCFIITPYRSPLQTLVDAIKSVIADRKLCAVVNKDFYDSDTTKDWSADIRRDIRRAKLVIAVGYADPATSKTRSSRLGRVSENVMYEIGLAHALAKPMLIIWDEKVPLPADIRNTRDIVPIDLHSIIAASASRTLENFKDRLSSHVATILRRVENNIIDLQWGDVDAIHGHESLFYDPSFVLHYQRLITFSSEIRNKINLLHVMFISPLEDHINTSLSGTPGMSGLIGRTETYSRYAKPNLVDPVLEMVRNHTASMTGALRRIDDRLAYFYPGHGQSIREHYDHTLKSIDQFRVYQDEFAQYVKWTSTIPLVPDSSTMLNLESFRDIVSKLLLQLKQASDQILTHSTALLLALCELNRREGGPFGSIF